MLEVKMNVKALVFVLGRMICAFQIPVNHTIKRQIIRIHARITHKKIVENKSSVAFILVNVLISQIATYLIKIIVKNRNINVYLMVQSVFRCQNVVIIKQRMDVRIKIKRVIIAFGLWVQRKNLPIYLKSHSMCNEGLNGCTISEQGYGCIEQMESCSQYVNYFQCFESKLRKDNCFWDTKNAKCVEKVCENIPFTQDYECKSYLSDCTTNGIHCVRRKQCSDAQNKLGCISDAQGNKCEYHENQCKNKSCDTAPNSLSNYQQCQDYDNLLDCVTSQIKGCKNRPVTCDGYAFEIDCYSIQKQDCVWYENKCEQRQCYHAPIYYSHIDCHQYGNCIGKLNGGCQITPQSCEDILQEQFCELNYNKEKCIWLGGKCVLLECNKLKLPYYKNHKICQQASQFCTFNLDSVGCTDYLCENVSEIEYCKIDSSGTICTLNQGCIQKQCKTAPPSYDTNQKCEGWMPKCTVNVQFVQNQKILIGCVDKKISCQLAIQDQCYTTISGFKCKWDGSSQSCIDQECTDADPKVYLTNDDCQQFQVFIGPCIIGSSGIGCTKWPTNCNQMINQQQCKLNLKDGTKCFWTGTYCKKQQCSDAPPINYTNNIECNTWFNNCIFNHSQGGCKDRPISLACTSSPNNNMYDTHQECFAWNPKCTVTSSYSVEGCEQKKDSCYEFIRQRNCKTTLNGQICYWDDKLQMCMNEDENNNGVADCDKRLYGDLTHQDCEEFMPKCTLNNIVRSCQYLSYYCDYQYKQQCQITRYQQPCKWDDLNQRCKNVVCTDNTTAQTEVECLKFKQQNECQLKIKSNGTYGIGCENRPTTCNSITDPVICKLTLTTNQHRCYYFNSICQVVQSNQCEVITESKSDEFCQLYNTQCVLQSSGQGCYSMFNCSDLSNKICNSAIMRYNQKCSFQDICRWDNDCSQKYLSSSHCNDQKTQFGQLCQYIYQCPWYCNYYCRLQTTQKNLTFSSSATLLDKYKQCQVYSSSYRYDTNCNCCVILTSCNLQIGSEPLCNLSIDQSRRQCGYNQQTQTCEDRKCEHLTSSQPISRQLCFEWKYNCVYDATGCKTFSGDCTTIGFIQQCYSLSCQWQDGKCVNHVNCELNTTAVTNRECLLINSSFCRLNYNKGQGCAFTNCSQITSSTICNSAQLANGERCRWDNYYSKCYNKYCQEYAIQSDCESSYGYISPIATKCYWCSIYYTKCTNNSYCNSSSMTLYKSHQDCNSVNVLTTIQFIISAKCTVKLQRCQDYIYQEACKKTIDGLDCYWYSNACLNICEAAFYLISSHTNSSCHTWNASCMQLNSSECQILDCNLLTTSANCAIFTEKCFWDGSNCQSIGDCSKYSTNTLCLNTSNSQDIPCFWNGTLCLEKTCSNKPTLSLNQSECDSWLVNCQWNVNNNQCVQDCTQANISNNTHQLCEAYYLNKSCTVKLDLIQCVDLPFSCPLAKKTQCYIDQSGNECYFQVSSGQCVNLLCSNLPSSYKKHETCNQRLKSCTVNTTLNGCQQLTDCSNYLIQDQCQIDSNKIECEWIISENKCTIKQCSTAQLPIYSAHSCQQYFGDSCTVNANQDGCETGQALCMKYTYNQCKSDGQMNLSGVDCFWNEEKSICLERICENGPPLAQSHSDCVGFLSTCQKGGCRIKGCFDYNYAIDTACASIFEDKRCVTNGYQCVLRNNCEDVKIIDGCTFDINLNPCVWINEKCQIKTCGTASVSLNKYLECNEYFPNCTVKQGGGCTKKQTCENYQIKEACFTDSENIECIWDDYLNQCFSNQCMDFCGDGVVSSKEEECDDGNYLPYDGCYKCQVQCPQGCNVCNGRICEDCQKKGWLLINGVCTSKCGDGYTVGSEQCDDGNYIEFDGCYQCSFSCHQKCLNCFQGLCLQCEFGYLEDGSQCHNICGDGNLIQQVEQCDDGNQQNNDGCSNTCEVEKNWKCQQENNISQCKYLILPMITLTKLTKTNSDNQEFQLSFSEKVRLNVNGISEEQFLQMIVVVLENANHNEYDVEIKPIISITTQLTDVAYKILVYFKSKIQNPLLKVTILCENIVNIQDNSLYSNEVKLVLKSPNKMSNDQKSLIQKTAFLSRIVMYIILIVSGIAFLFGNLEILWNLLDMLQQLSYMKFHNLQFPENLKIYFEIFSIGSFTPIINFFQTDIYLQNLFDYQIPIIPAKWKFEEYEINCYFLNNFQTLIILIIIGFAYFLVSFFFYKFLILIKYQNWPTIFYKSKSQSLFKFVRFIFSFQKLARKQCSYFVYSGLIRILTSNYYELTFASILQIANYNIDTTLNTTILLIALITLQFNLILIVLFFSYLSKKDKVSKKLSVLVEGINNHFSQGSKQYFTILLIKKTLFLFNLIVLQKLFGAQSLITACLSGVFSCYIYIYKPFENNYENLKIFITEIMIMLNVILFSVYDIIKFNQNKDSAEVLGWINVGGFTLILIFTLLIDIYQQLQKYIRQFRKNFINQKKNMKSKNFIFFAI
ncbi:unnamed protein product [Paramecium pentaurelia]|uniref:Uncharacterized protein n=1 Tax=Paramecium pentaurelia TaxID=43138 RepID=A0A8S1YHD1_9CILI|nr:unnamed protein product [Paramecium pentaurelia]